jgi:hypothetical protein
MPSTNLLIPACSNLTSSNSILKQKQITNSIRFVEPAYYILRWGQTLVVVVVVVSRHGGGGFSWCAHTHNETSVPGSSKSVFGGI